MRSAARRGVTPVKDQGARLGGGSAAVEAPVKELGSEEDPPSKQLSAGSQGHGVTGSQGHKVTGSQDHRVTGSRGHRVTASQGHRVTRYYQYK